MAAFVAACAILVASVATFPTGKTDAKSETIDTTMFAIAPAHAQPSEEHIACPHAEGVVDWYEHFLKHLVPSSDQPLQPRWQRGQIMLSPEWQE